MAREFFIGRGEKQYGPFTATELRDLGVDGKIQPTDVVWRDGSNLRTPATKVKGLLPAAVAVQPGGGVAAAEPRTEPDNRDSSACIETEFEIPTPQAPADLVVEPEQPTEKQPARLSDSVDSPIASVAKPREREAERPRRVISIRGGRLVSQDGKHVVFRRVCDTCGDEAQGRLTVVIRPGAMKIPYFCRKCRKGRQVEMMGVGG
jgi:hypothetical protein